MLAQTDSSRQLFLSGEAREPEDVQHLLATRRLPFEAGRQSKDAAHLAAETRKESQMKKKTFISVLPILLLFAFLVTACEGTSAGHPSTPQTGTGTKSKFAQNAEEEKETEEEVRQLTDELYAVVSTDTVAGTIRLYHVAKQRQEDYTYNEGTVFLDKYGKLMSMAGLLPGKVVQLETYRKTGELRTVQVSDAVWEYDDVSRFLIDTDENIIEIAGTKYYYQKDLQIFSDDKTIPIGEIGEDDVLRVQGQDRKILTISVTSGHGSIRLTNTDLFEGGWLSLDSNRYYKVTKDMQLELPEGSYLLSVANDGYGDDKEITVERGKELVIDLNELKGEGPKYCTVTFEVGVDNAVMTIDGQQIDYKEPQKLKYGIHQLEIVAEGYDTWSKRLYVHSKEATIQVAMTSDGTTVTTPDSTTTGSTQSSGTGTTDNTISDSNQTAGSLAGSRAGSITGSKSGTTSGNSSKNQSSFQQSVDGSVSDNSYLQKLADVLDTLTSRSSNSTKSD